MSDYLEKARGFLIDRRTFTASAAVAVSAIALGGCSTEHMLTSASKNTQKSKEGSWKTLPCLQACGGRCINKGYVVDGVITRQKTDDTHADSPEYPQQRGCLKGRALRDYAFGADRLKYPMKRKHWSPDDPHGELRGKDEWERISWDEALDYTANELKKAYEKYGPRSILVPGWTSATQSALLNYLGGYTSTWDSVSYGTYLLDATKLGLPTDDRQGACNDRLDMMKNADTIVCYGNNPAWSAMGSTAWYYMQAKKRGAEFISVTPEHNSTANLLDARHIYVRPGTDTAFLLAVAHEMLRMDEDKHLIDWDFLHTYCVGFDSDSMPKAAKEDENFKDYVLGVYDETPKTPEWASEICGTPTEDITWFASKIGKDTRVMLLHAQAPARCNGAEDFPQLFMTIGCMGGHIGKPGHSTGGYYVDGGADGANPLVVTGDDGEGVAAQSFHPTDDEAGERAVDDCINALEMWDAVITGKYHYVGDPSADNPQPGEDRDIDIHVIDGTGWTAMRSMPNTRRGVEAHQKVDFVTYRYYLPVPNAIYADIILPTVSEMEMPGILGNDGDCPREFLAYYSQVCEPLYECKEPSWIEREILKRMGEDPDGLHPLSEKQKLFNKLSTATVVTENGKDFENLVKITQDDINEWGVDGEPQDGRIGLADYAEQGIYQVERHYDDNYGVIAYEDFINDPEANPLDTESGKFEIYCQWKADTLNSFGFSDDVYKGYPTYHVPSEGYETTFSDWENKVKGEYPFLLIQPHYLRTGNTVFGNVPVLAETATLPLFMNSDDAAELGLKEGDTALISSRWGQILRRISESELMMPGVVALPNGGWPKFDENGIDRGGCTNTLMGGKPAGMGVSGYNNLNVKIEHWKGDELPDDADMQIVLEIEE